MQILDTATGPGLTLDEGEVLTRSFLLRSLIENEQILPDAADDWLNVLFESLEEHDGEDLDLVQA